MKNLVEWYKSEFKRRTDLLAAGNGRIDWIDPGTRVSFSEIWAKAEELGIEENPVTLRIVFGNLKKPIA